MSDRVKFLKDDLERRFVVLTQALRDFYGAVQRYMSELEALVNIQEKYEKKKKKGVGKK